MKLSAILAVLLLLAGVCAAAAQTITIGDAAQEANGDSGNGNLLVAQQTTLNTVGTLQSLSFEVGTGAGNLILGVYDDSGNGNNGPGKLLATTASFVPVRGWNTKVVTAPVILQPGTYWLAYAPSSNNLTFYKQNDSGPCSYYSKTFAALPTVWGGKTFGNCTPTTWSFYATLTAAAPPPPPPPPSTVFTGPYSETIGTTTTTGTATCTAVNPTTVNCTFSPPLPGPMQ